MLQDRLQMASLVQCEIEAVAFVRKWSLEDISFASERSNIARAIAMISSNRMLDRGLCRFEFAAMSRSEMLAMPAFMMEKR